jgi:hypothetical protein
MPPDTLIQGLRDGRFVAHHETASTVGTI